MAHIYRYRTFGKVSSVLNVKCVCFVFRIESEQ